MQKELCRSSYTERYDSKIREVSVKNNFVTRRFVSALCRLQSRLYTKCRAETGITMEITNHPIEFGEIVGEIEKEQILLPDFQRKFTWTKAETQISLVASVLCKMPIGSILLLKLPASEYAARRIGRNSSGDLALPDRDGERQFLLDGQQRVTVLINAFSNLLHECEVNRIDSLKRRFFLGIPRPENKEEYGRNDWGFSRLCFPLRFPDKDSTDYMTEDVADRILTKDFRVGDEQAINPYRPENRNGLLEFCLHDKQFYLIPLYLLAWREDQKICKRNERELESILKTIAEKQGNYLITEYEILPDEQARREWCLNNWEDEEPAYIEELIRKEESLQNEITHMAKEWAEAMQKYLRSCLERMNLHIMSVPNSNRAKAIEIFENLNRGGVRLGTFDLVMARAARDNRDFSGDLLKQCAIEGVYPEECVPERIRDYSRRYTARKRAEKTFYNALYDIECINEKNGEFTKGFQDAFLNVLSLKCHNDKIKNNVQRNFREEMSKKSILNLSSGEINGNYKQCCTALDRAAFFLKARCGIRKITEINYHLMFTVLAFLFFDEEKYRQKKVWDLLTAWYWCAVFAGRYDKDQNVQAERDIRALSQILYREGNMDYIQEMRDSVLQVPFFSDKKFLLYENGLESDVRPKEVLAQYFCQFYLAEGYSDLLQPDSLLCTFPVDPGAEELEKHHLIPLKSAQSIAESERLLNTDAEKHNIVNSPLNRIYITAKGNKIIAAKDFSSYLKYIQPEAVHELDLPVPPERIADANMKEILEERYVKLHNRLMSNTKTWLKAWKK